MLNRRSFLKLSGWGAVSAALTRPTWADVSEKQLVRPNILLFFPDQHRYDWTSMNPALPDLTPNLKKLTARGVHFSNAVCASPLCAPSRACLASGKEYPRCGVANNGGNYPLDQPTFYGLLRAAGYHVLGCGKFDLAKPAMTWGADGKQRRPGLPSKLKMWGFTDGIDNAGKMDGWNAYRHHIPEPYFAFLERNHMVPAFGKNYKILDHDYPGPPILPDKYYADNWIAGNGLSLLREVPRGAPWFLQVNFNGPHGPMDITKSMYEKWKETRFPPPADAKITPKTAKKRRNYGAMINNIDRLLGVYLDTIEQRGELSHTVIAYCSDHGEMLGDHGYWAKSRPLQPSASVPLVLAGPGIRAQGKCDSPVETMDLTATFLDLAGVPRPSDMDSKSMRPYLSGEGALPRSVVRSALGKWKMAYDGRYKLIRGRLRGKVPRRDQDKHLVLYDLRNDPNETTDVSSEHPDVVARLSRAFY